jgi:TDG/mug DNA glycosylase family protein
VVQRRRLLSKVKRFRAECIAVLAVRPFRMAFVRAAAIAGRQPECFGTTLLWLLSNPSGLNAH